MFVCPNEGEYAWFFVFVGVYLLVCLSEWESIYTRMFVPVLACLCEASHYVRSCLNLYVYLYPYARGLACTQVIYLIYTSLNVFEYICVCERMK